MSRPFRLFRAVVCLVSLAVVPIEPGTAQPFAIEVLDSKTGRGVPLVEVRDALGNKHYTDSNGIVAFDDSAQLDQDVQFAFSSYGYSSFNQTLMPVLGGSAQVEIDRINRAERLYRITGTGIYEDSVAVGRSVPISHPLLNANVRGQDSVQAAIHNGQIHWLWGDTLYENGFGNFRTSGAVSQLPGQGGLSPAEGIELEYFSNSGGSSREMMPSSDPGPIWMDGFFEIEALPGVNVLVSHYVRVKSFLPVYELYEQGLALYVDQEQEFQEFRNYSLDAPIVPQGHTFEHVSQGTEYIYFAQDYPNVRVRKDWNDVVDISQWEAFTPFLANTRYDPDNPPLELDNEGKPVFGWKKNTDPLSSNILEALVQNGHLDREEAPFGLKDFESGSNVRLHRASVHWNEYRQKWIMIGTEAFGDSFLGEVWFSEAHTPEGPWEYAIKIATHDGPTRDYTFYNPTSHPFFDEEGGRLIYFQGTYSNSFSNNPDPTPLYDYNQIMYRLDLGTIPSLVAPLLAGDFNEDGVVNAGDYNVWLATLGQEVAPGTGADGDGSGQIDQGDYLFWKVQFGSSSIASPHNPVPEPSAVIFLLGTVLALWSRLSRFTCRPADGA